MRQLMNFLAILAAGLVIGCQDSNVTGPAWAPKDNSFQLRGIVEIDGRGKIEVDGGVLYSLIQSRTLNKRPYPEDEYVEPAIYDLGITTSAGFRPAGLSKQEPYWWKVSGNSTDRIYFTGNSGISLEKKYRIHGMARETYLHLNFKVNRAGLSFDRMWTTIHESD